MRDLAIDIAPVRRWRAAAVALKLRDLPEPADVRQRVEAGDDPARAVVGYLEGLVSAVLSAEVCTLHPETLGKALLAEELLFILTGSDDIDRVRAWMRAR